MNTEQTHGQAPQRAGLAPDAIQRFSAPRGSASHGQLIFERGASLVTLGGDQTIDDLFQAQCAGPAARVQANGGTVIFRYQRLPLREWARYALLWGHYASTLRLSTALPWQITVRGGASRLSADLGALRLAGLAVFGGASELSIELPEPRGVVRLQFVGGVNRVTLRRPAGVAVSLRVDGGASRLSLDTQHFGSVGGGVRLESAGGAAAANRYEIEVAGGANMLALDAW